MLNHIGETQVATQSFNALSGLCDVVAVLTFNDVPAVNHTFKYERLGRLAIENRRRYCDQHGYAFVQDVPIAADRPACWAKIPAILAAFERHRWVLWADSDTLVMDRSRRLEDFIDEQYDLIVQSHELFYEYIGINVATGLERMPINTGVFLIQATEWSKEFLRRAYDKEQFVSTGEIWNGIGEQEAMIQLLHEHPEDRSRIGYVQQLQNHPKFYRPGDTFVHFYGNHAHHRIPLATCEKVIRRWEDADQGGHPFPLDLARFHWCCIQNKSPDGPVQRGDLDRYLYNSRDIETPVVSSSVFPTDALSIYGDAYTKEYTSLYLHPWKAKHQLNVRNIESLLDDIRHQRTVRWLDLACGQAWHFSNAGRGVRKVGLDLSRAQLEAAQRVNPEASFIRGDMASSVFRGASFDLVTSFWGAYCYLENVDRILAFLHNAIESTRPGGAFYMEVLLAEDLEAFNQSIFAGRTGFRVSPRRPDYSQWSYRDSGGEHIMMSPPLDLFVSVLSQSFARVEAEHDSGFMVHLIATGRCDDRTAHR